MHTIMQEFRGGIPTHRAGPGYPLPRKNTARIQMITISYGSSHVQDPRRYRLQEGPRASAPTDCGCTRKARLHHTSLRRCSVVLKLTLFMPEASASKNIPGVVCGASKFVWMLPEVVGIPGRLRDIKTTVQESSDSDHSDSPAASVDKLKRTLSERKQHASTRYAMAIRSWPSRTLCGLSPAAACHRIPSRKHRTPLRPGTLHSQTM
jgi:hypothetical protein